MIPGGASYATLDKVTWLQDTANDPGQPEQVRRQAELELEQIEQGAAVHPAWQRVRDLTTTAATSRSQDAARLAEEALAKLHAEQRTAGKRRSASSRPKAPVVEDREAWPPRTFVHTWQSFTPGWWDHFDVAVLVDKLTRTEIDEFFNPTTIFTIAAPASTTIRTRSGDRGVKPLTRVAVRTVPVTTISCPISPRWSPRLCWFTSVPPRRPIAARRGRAG